MVIISLFVVCVLAVGMGGCIGALFAVRRNQVDFQKANSYRFDKIDKMLLDSYWETKQIIGSTHSLCVTIAGTQMVSKVKEPKPSPVIKPKTGANRRERTEQEKKAASEKRTLWWEEKRKREAESSPQEVTTLPALEAANV